MILKIGNTEWEWKKTKVDPIEVEKKDKEKFFIYRHKFQFVTKGKTYNSFFNDPFHDNREFSDEFMAAYIIKFKFLKEKYFPKKITLKDCTKITKTLAKGVVKDLYSITISNVEYRMAMAASQNMASNDKKGKYGEGILNTQYDPFRAERIGRLGEIALSKILGCDADIAYRIKGDETDIVFNDTKIDVKTASKCHDYHKGLITHTEEGKQKQLSSDVYFFNYLESDSRANKESVVVFVGAVTRETVLTKFSTPCKGRNWKSDHLNYEVPYENLKLFRMFEQ